MSRLSLNEKDRLGRSDGRRSKRWQTFEGSMGDLVVIGYRQRLQTDWGLAEVD